MAAGLNGCVYEPDLDVSATSVMSQEVPPPSGGGITAIHTFGSRPFTEKKSYFHHPYLPFLRQWPEYTKVRTYGGAGDRGKIINCDVCSSAWYCCGHPYDQADFLGDLSSGILSGVVVVPQGLAYGKWLQY